MPTGYTEAIYENRDETFESFVWRCARGMGACVMMRDEPLSKLPPERFEPSDFHLKEKAKVERRLVEVKAMTLEQLEEAAKQEIEETKKRRLAANVETEALCARYEAMLKKVEAWEPPLDHEGLKDFMIEQLEKCIDFEGTTFVLDIPELSSGAKWLDRKIEKYEDDIAYHEREYKKEVERTEERNQWLAKLRESVPMPEKLP